MDVYQLPVCTQGALQLNRDAVVLCEQNGNIVFHNKAFQSLFHKIQESNQVLLAFDDLEIVSSKWRKRIFWNDLVDDANEKQVSISVYFPSLHANFIMEINEFFADEKNFIAICFRNEFSFFSDWNDEFIFKSQQKLLDELPIMIAGIDRTGVFKFVNLEMLNELKYDRKDILNSGNFIDQIIPNPRKQKEIIEKVLREEDGKIRSIQLDVLNGSGQQRSVQMFVVYTPQSSVRDICYWLVGNDNTAYHKALMSLVESEERYSFISKVSNDAVWDWDLITDKLWWNEGVTSIFGYTADEVENTYQWWLERVHPSYLEHVNESLQMHVREKKDFWTQEYLFKKKDGSYAFVFDKGYLIKDQKGHPVRFVGGMVDITDIKNAADLP